MGGIDRPEKILAKFLDRQDIRLPVQRLKACLPPGAELWVIGGAPRNALIEAIHGKSPPTEDIDLFIDAVDPGLDLARLDLEGRLRPTELGGVRWFPSFSPFSFDIGILSQFLIIEKFRLDPTPQSLLGAIDFDVNAVMWSWEREQMLAAGCVDAISRKVMSFNTTLVFDKVLLAYRILVTRHKTGFWLSKNIFDYVRNTLDLERMKRLRTMLAAKLGKTTAGAVMQDCDLICRCKSHMEYRTRLPSRG